MARVGRPFWFAKLIKRQKDNQAQLGSYANSTLDAPILQMQGVAVGVPAQTTLLAISAGSDGLHPLILPLRLLNESEVEDGTVCLYATSADGKQIVGQIALENDGKLMIATNQDDFLVIIKEMLALLQSLQTFGNSVQQVPPPDWLAQAKMLEQRLDNLAKYK